MWLNVTNTAIRAENLKLKFWNLSQWDTAGEESADLTALCSLSHCASDSAPTQMGIPAAQYVASTGCSRDLATLWQQWQEKTGCISGGGKERNVLKQMRVLSWEGSFRRQDLCQGSRGQLQCLTGLAQPLTPRSPCAATYASPQQSSVTSHEPSLGTTTNQESNKAACTSVSYSLTCSPFMWLTI